jgi:hypothetical protein
MPILSRRQPYRNPAIKDPASEVTTEQNLQIRVISGRLTSDLTRRRQSIAIQADLVIWRRVGVKDPAALPPPDSTLQTRARQVLGVQPANQVARARRNATTQADLVLWQLRRAWRKDPAKEVTTEQNLRARNAVGGQVAALMARRRQRQSQQAALRLLRQNSWLAPNDTIIYVGEVYLTELGRVIAFTEPNRATLTELARLLAFTEIT